VSLVNTPLLTHELGSLAKPNWRVKGIAGRPIEHEDLDDARAWGEKLGVDGHEELLGLLGKGSIEADDKAEIKRWSSRYGVRFLEKVGLDVVYDGEQQRSEMYAWAIAHANGFEWRGSVRAFDNKYYSKAAVTGPISLRVPYHNDEFELMKSFARAELKVPITGAYTIADWSFDEA
jgi:5-methyltetrahydropteroyltriglutamate--homocysteine methyltransferase